VTIDRAGVLVRAVEATVSGETSAVGELFTADVVAWSPVVSVSSREELAVELEDQDDAFSNVELEVTVVAVGAEYGCAEWVASAIHSGPAIVDEQTVLGATGRRVCVHGVSVVEFAGDRIRALRHYWDEVELVAGLGLLPGE
jgi:hypothetical protein